MFSDVSILLFTEGRVGEGEEGEGCPWGPSLVPCLP